MLISIRVVIAAAIETPAKEEFAHLAISLFIYRLHNTSKVALMHRGKFLISHGAR